MKIKTALIVSLLILNGSAYAMVANSLPLPVSFFPPRTKEQVQILKVSIPNQALQAIPKKTAKIYSKLDSLILEYQVSRALGASS